MVRAIEVARKSIFMFIHIIHQQRYMLPVSPSLSRTYFIATANSVWRESQDTVLDALTAGLLDCIFRFTHHVHSSSRILLVHMYLRKMPRTGSESDEKPQPKCDPSKTLWNSWRSVQIDHHVVASSNNVVDSGMISHDDSGAHNNQIQYPKNPKTKHQYKQQ